MVRRGFAIRIMRRLRTNGVKASRVWPTAIYLSSYDPDAMHGEGVVRYLDNIDAAKIYPTLEDAMHEIDRRSRFYPHHTALARRFELKIVEVSVDRVRGVVRVTPLDPEFDNGNGET
jgi:hypothetical protein